MMMTIGRFRVAGSIAEVRLLLPIKTGIEWEIGNLSARIQHSESFVFGELKVTLLNALCPLTMNQLPKEQGAIMAATGELIRMMNYVDDIAAILRRVNTSLPTMSEEEKSASPNTSANPIPAWRAF